MRFEIPATGWYVLSMTAVVDGQAKVIFKRGYSVLQQRFTAGKSGYSVVQFPDVVYLNKSRSTNRTHFRWCREDGSVDILFASVHLQSL